MIDGGYAGGHSGKFSYFLTKNNPTESYFEAQWNDAEINDSKLEQIIRYIAIQCK